METRQRLIWYLPDDPGKYLCNRRSLDHRSTNRNSDVYLHGTFLSDRLHKVLKPIVDLLAGIPSIVYGFFGLVVMVPFVREHFKGNGQSILTITLLLGIMILPTIISVSESSIRAVEESYYEEHSHWEPHMREVSLRLLFRLQNQVCLQQLCSA